MLHIAPRVALSRATRRMGYGKRAAECRERKASPTPFVTTFEGRPSFVLLFFFSFLIFFSPSSSSFRLSWTHCSFFFLSWRESYLSVLSPLVKVWHRLTAEPIQRFGIRVKIFSSFLARRSVFCKHFSAADHSGIVRFSPFCCLTFFEVILFLDNLLLFLLRICVSFFAYSHVQELLVSEPVLVTQNSFATDNTGIFSFCLFIYSFIESLYLFIHLFLLRSYL